MIEAIKVREAAKNDEDKLAAELTIEHLRQKQLASVEAAELRKSMKGFLELRIMTVFIALPFAMHSFAVNMDSIFLFDWNVAQLPEPYSEYQGTILLWFFGLQASQSLASTIAAALKRS